MSHLKRITLIGLTLMIALLALACSELTVVPTDTPIPATPSSQGFVDLGRYKLVYECYGEGSPAVIVEAGGGDKPVVSYTWKPVVQGIYNTTKICIYNRAEVYTSEDAARDLHELLANIPVQGPYLLVAHSLGGWNARVFTHLYPDEVAGLILVDTTPLDPQASYAPAFPTYSPGEDPAAAGDRTLLLTATPQSSFGSMDLVTSAEQVRAAGSLGDLPLTVIVHDVYSADYWEQYYPWMDKDDRERMIEATLQLQADMAALSTRGELIIANTDQHYISMNDPATVIDAIERMLQLIIKT